MNLEPRTWNARALTRRQFFRQSGLSLGVIALGGLLSREGYAGAAPVRKIGNPLAPQKPPFAPRAKSIIYLHMSGAPPSLDLFDWKPKLVELHLKPCPEELLKGQRFVHQRGAQDARFAVQVCPIRQERRVGDRTASPLHGNR